MARVVFMGTPDLAVASLRALAAQHTVVGVVTQPGRPAGRGRQVVEPPVKLWASQAGLPVIQPRRVREPDAMAKIAAWAPEIIVVAAFGQILKPDLLALPPRGCVNVHASLLPRHRGAAPVAAAILAGDAVTGITLMLMDAGLDTGPILARQPMQIGSDDTTQSLTERLAGVGAALLVEALPRYLGGKLEPRPQDDGAATYAPQLKKQDGHMDFSRPAEELERRVRAYNPWPGAFAFWPEPGAVGARQLRVWRARVLDRQHSLGEPGQVMPAAGGPAVVCGRGALLLLEVQPAGRQAMPANAYARGARGFIGARLK